MANQIAAFKSHLFCSLTGNHTKRLLLKVSRPYSFILDLSGSVICIYLFICLVSVSTSLFVYILYHRLLKHMTGKTASLIKQNKKSSKMSNVFFGVELTRETKKDLLLDYTDYWNSIETKY